MGHVPDEAPKDAYVLVEVVITLPFDKKKKINQFAGSYVVINVDSARDPHVVDAEFHDLVDADDDELST